MADASAAARVVDAQQLDVLRGALRAASGAFPDDDLESAARRFLEALGRPKCPGFSLGYAETFVLFGPPYASGRFVMLPALITDRHCSRRGMDLLEPRQTPHVTAGRFREGCGVEHGGGLALEWAVSSPPVWNDERGSLEWIRDCRVRVPIRKVVNDLAVELARARCFERPLPCRAYLDEDECSWVLADGAAVEVYLAFREALVRHFRHLDVDYAFEPWCCRSGSNWVHISTFCEDPVSKPSDHASPPAREEA